MKKIILSITALFVLITVVSSQTTGEVELKDSGYGQKKFDNAPKKIYIAQFRVIYQLMADWTESTDGGSMIGGGVRGKATARLAVGIKGVEETDLQEITDKLYAEYLEKLKNDGYELVSADDAAKTEQYADFERKTGGELSQAQYPGYIMSIPSGYDYFIKRTTKKGVEKKTFIDDSGKLSASLDKAVVAKVNLVVKFINEAESGASKALGKLSGGIAKLVMETELRLDNEPVLGAGTFTTDVTQTQAMYSYAERKIATDATSTFTMKNQVNIDGVMGQKKYKSVETAQTDFIGADIGAMRLFSADNTYFENLQAVEVNPADYKKGVEDAGLKFLNATWNEFLSNAK